MQDEADFRRKRRIVLIAGATVLLALFAWLFDLLVQPALPRSVAISTGPADGAYHAFAQQYRAHLARYGVDLVLKPSSGSVENLERLRTRRDGVRVALVQGGLATAAEAPGIMTLGSLFYEPVWLFWRDKPPLQYISDLRGKRIAIGGPGSGVRALAVRLLKANGIDEGNAQLDPSGGLNAAEKLESGALDIAVFVNAPEAPAIQRLLRAKGIRLGNVVRADAYVRQLPFLQRVVLPAGVLDLAQNLPAQDQVLIAATANLLAADDLHPVIVDLLLEAARKVHGGGSVLNAPGEFPALRDREFPASSDAERIYNGDYSFLRQYAPFWLAVWVQRFVFFAIPVIAIGIPLVRYVPALYQWGARRRIYRWYGELKFLELALRREAGDLARHRERLDEIEERVNGLSVPLAYSGEYYTLRTHIGLVRGLLDARLARAQNGRGA
jgi:TRAP-type uncharacterized transport system substrate-binding protein